MVKGIGTPMLEELGIERISCCGVGEPFLVLQFLFPTGVDGWMGGWVKRGDCLRLCKILF
jgi:hypothetical protein